MRAPTGYALLQASPRPRLLEAGETGLYDALAKASAPVVGVDAPLHPPYTGFRRVERRAQGLGAKFLPGGSPGMKALSTVGLSIAWLLRETGRVPVETHPATAARLLGVDRRRVWRLLGGRHAGDAYLAALAALCYVENKALIVEEEDGLLVFPDKTRYCIKILWEAIG